jgi:hypothetical protein
MMSVVGIVGESDEDPGTVSRTTPDARSCEVGMIAEYGVASLDSSEQFGIGALL